MLQTQCLVLLCVLCVRTYATVTQLDNLLEIHKRVKDDLHLYIKNEEKKLSYVKWNLDIFKREHERAMEDIPGYLGNPINAFTLIKRLTSDLKYLKDSIKIERASFKRPDVQYPTQKDLTGAAKNLGMVLETYDLDVKELIEGKINGIPYSTPMTAGDCFELGRLLFKGSSYDSIRYARKFLVEAYKKYNEEDMFYPFSDVDIIEHISMACSKMGDIESALQWTQTLLEVDPEHSQAVEIIAYFKRILAAEKKLAESGDRINAEEIKDNATVMLQRSYKALCRGIIDIPAEVSSRLICYYSSKYHPFLKLAPFKIELLYLNPNIILFHDVLSNDEIEAIKQMSTLKYTEQSSATSDQTSPYDGQRNLSVWLRDMESDIVARISRRVADMTGLNVATSTQLNVIKYGFGDTYVPHYDFDSMSNVPLGGATVFPALGLSVFPAKGGAISFLNLHASGEGDLAKIHADCPTVHGSKWVASKWIYQCDQHLLNLCDGGRQNSCHEFSRPLSITSSLDILFTICLLPSNPYIDVNGELISAVSNIEDLINTQKRIIDNLDYYFHKEDKRLARMKKILDTFQREHKNARKDVHTYLSNPIIFFSFLKRISIDLDHIKDYSIMKAEYLMNFTLVDKSIEYPTQKDLKGTAEVIAVLQETYKLDVKELAAGKLNGVLYSAPMTAGDCYELGRNLYQCVEYVKVCAWMIEAFRKYDKEKNDYYFTEVDILEYIIFAYFLLDDMENALKWTYTLLDTHPNNSRARHNIPLYLKKIALEKSKLVKIQNVKALSEPDIMEIYNKVQKAYEAQCRGETVVTFKTDRRLTCRYLSENHAFLKIAPLKMEIMFINPDVVLFHDVLSDIEIEKLKKTARSKFKRAVIPAQHPDQLNVVTQSSWVYHTESDVVERISRRVADMTGFNVKAAEPLQVVNYGIGGHYKLHYDTPSSAHINCTKHDKSRIATVMFYMSEVALGGATVFTHLGLTVYPIKGAAVFWNNTHPSGERNPAMIHAACPVLLGSKWGKQYLGLDPVYDQADLVSNKFIRHCGQEFSNHVTWCAKTHFDPEL